MKLTAQEMDMLAGKEGLARQKAMELLVQYGEALGADRLVDTNNVCGSLAVAKHPFSAALVDRCGGEAGLFSELHLNTPAVLDMPPVKTFACQLQTFIDPENWQAQGATRDHYAAHLARERFTAELGIQLLSTCAPYLAGNVPVLGEHCAWMESSAVAYINSVIGARSNVEGRESAFAAMLTGKIPYWGFHLPAGRLGTHLVAVEWETASVMDWGLLGYHVGKMVQEQVPVLRGSGRVPELEMLKHFSAAAASSGGVEMFHLPGVTPEARTVAEAFGGRKPVAQLKFGPAERRQAYEQLNATARDTDVDFVMFGCPHASIKQVRDICRRLEGKRVADHTRLWVYVPRAVKAIADRNGYTRVISGAGGVLMSDTCCAMSGDLPPGTRVVATDSAKQAHYLPSMLGVQCWFGSLDDCINAAVSGRWCGELS